MNVEDSIEQRIRDLLASEQDAISLSDKLFSPEGLFNILATSPAERRIVVESLLLKEAQRRLTALMQKEAREFAGAIEQFQAHRCSNPTLHRFERVRESNPRHRTP